jgi:tRNA 5-methylaminomethyl-2-thiouridine biosynthesis bifunctional protein
MGQNYLLDQAEISWDEAGHPYSSKFNDVYYARDGGLQEKQYVFLDLNHLRLRWQNLPASSSGHFTLVETGFGTGLNFLLTNKLWCETAPPGWHLHYLSIERYPLAGSELQRIIRAFPRELAGNHLLEVYPDPSVGFHRRHFDHNVNLTFLYDDVLECLNQLDCVADAWFMDGFTPANNAAMWSEQVCARIFQISRPGATLSTYSSAGWVRRGLQSAGFEIHKQPGFGRKRELLCGTKPGIWKPAVAPANRQAVVIGAGLAGTSCAYALARRGFDIHLVERGGGVAEGATGMHQLAFYPQLAANPNWQSLYSLQAFQYSAHHLHNLSADGHMDWQASGFIKLETHERDREQHRRLRQHFGSANQLARWVTPDLASKTSGLQLAHGGFYYPKAGWVDPGQLCDAQIDHPRIEVIYGREISSLTKTADGWSLRDGSGNVLLQSPLVIIANGYLASRFDQLHNLPLTPVRGQTSLLRARSGFDNPKTIIGGTATLFPQHRDRHNLAATYDPGDDDIQIRNSDHQMLQENLQGMITADYPSSPDDSLVGIRAVSRDRFPVTGAVPEWNSLLAHYSPLRRNAHAVVPGFRNNLPGLYVATGFGSHGLNQIPLCAEHLASVINGEPDPLPRSMAELISPIRFLIRDLKQQKA